MNILKGFIMNNFPQSVLVLCFSVLFSLSPDFCLAQDTPKLPTSSVTRKQPAKTPKPKYQTIVRLELFYDPQAGGGLQSQQWMEIFQPLDISVRIRSKTFNDKPAVKESIRGTFRYVTAVGELNRKGLLVFPQKTFSRTDGDQLKEWITGLQTFGAQGNPAGQKLWGLNPKQFVEIHSALKVKLEKKTNSLSLNNALKQFDIPRKYPVRFSVESQTWLKTEYSTDPLFRGELSGLSKGTALAILLNQFGLGFQPLRTSNGGLELFIQPLKVTHQVWPIGWPSKQTNLKTAPGLFKLVPVDLENVLFLDVISAISSGTKIPIHVDFYRVEGFGLDVTKLKVSHPAKQTSFSLVLKALTVPHRMTRKLLVDEAGNPFVWITIFVPKP